MIGPNPPPSRHLPTICRPVSLCLINLPKAYAISSHGDNCSSGVRVGGANAARLAMVCVVVHEPRHCVGFAINGWGIRVGNGIVGYR